MRNIAILCLTVEAWQHLNAMPVPPGFGYHHHPLLAQSVPADAVLLAIDEDFENARVLMKYEHPSFESSSEGQAYPRLYIRGVGIVIFAKDLLPQEEHTTDGIES